MVEETVMSPHGWGESNATLYLASREWVYISNMHVCICSFLRIQYKASPNNRQKQG